MGLYRIFGRLRGLKESRVQGVWGLLVACSRGLRTLKEGRVEFWRPLEAFHGGTSSFDVFSRQALEPARFFWGLGLSTPVRGARHRMGTAKPTLLLTLLSFWGPAEKLKP